MWALDRGRGIPPTTRGRARARCECRCRASPSIPTRRGKGERPRAATREEIGGVEREAQAVVEENGIRCEDGHLDEILSVYGRGRPKLILTRGTWEPLDIDGERIRARGRLMFKNNSETQELFVPDIVARAQVLSRGSIDGVSARVKIRPRHDLADGYESPDTVPREDDYWSTYILQGSSRTFIDLVVTIEAGEASVLREVTACCVEVEYGCYGPSGLETYSQHVVLPIHYPDPSSPPKVFSDQTHAKGGEKATFSLHSVPTHLLYHDDDPLDVVERYVKPHAQPGDILAVAETPLAIMQGRYRHPTTIAPSFLARVLCKLFHPTSSVATACGMQALVDIVGPIRALFAAVVGVFLKFFRISGFFYKMAGAQAGLLDDISGTIAPYDKFICLGPRNVQRFVDSVEAKFGLGAAVVDVNDLSKKTKLLTILAKTRGVDEDFVHRALLPNPAGNADQQTPFVLIRPAQKASAH